MTNQKTLFPVIDQHDRDGQIIAYASTEQEAESILRADYLNCDPDADEIKAFDARNNVSWYSDAQQFDHIDDADLVNGYWAQT
jgi:hypothetical protein